VKNIDEWDGSVLNMPGCNCLCTIAHPGKDICNIEAPRALLTMDVYGTLLGKGTREVVMCAPCAEDGMASHPRARGIVVLAAEEKTP